MHNILFTFFFIQLEQYINSLNKIYYKINTKYFKVQLYNFKL